jgi:RPA family protein
MESEKKYLRQIAVKVKINELVNGKYVQNSDQEPNYLMIQNGEKIFRANVMAIVISKEKIGSITNFLLDDGSGKIVLRSFEENKFLDKIDIGETVLVIGKLREYNQEKYFSSEIIKKIDPVWLKIRNLELGTKVTSEILESNDEKGEVIIEDKKTEVSEKLNENKNKFEEPIEDEVVEEEEIFPVKKLIKIIKENDNGEGILIEELIEISPLDETEKLIEKMLESGDVFQNLPGRIKVL